MARVRAVARRVPDRIAEELGLELSAFAAEMEETYRRTGAWRGSRMELRLVLFFLAGLWHWDDSWANDLEHLQSIRELLDAIRAG